MTTRNQYRNQSRKMSIGVSCFVSLTTVSLVIPVHASQVQDPKMKAALATAVARGARIKVQAKPSAPKIIAVRIRHDMCPFCKGFDPQFPKLVEQTKEESVLWITLDMSNDATQNQAALLVAAMDLENIWTGDLSRMGTITFLDAKTTRVILVTLQSEIATVKNALGKAISALDS